MSPPLGPEGASTRDAGQLFRSLETNTASGLYTGRQGRYVPRACEECRSRHLKCNGVQAGCDRCTADNRVCVYSLVPDRRRTAANADATEKIQLSKSRLAKLLKDCAQALSENEQLKNDLRQPAYGPSALGDVESQRHMFSGQSAIFRPHPSRLLTTMKPRRRGWTRPHHKPPARL
ncbi:hypothetical protein EXIGLDRAFT_442148 [Exidia glandulosa HHB12029]|uniref:Zn(2)-C6 fungal-type domain-containing protein n=1 Tax=Exidia glandulosa HHB12029 TaxID=1314781 RepID=A0A165KBM0_EXIGL|nr:hypothetical protein EXIGLDRAFT_442148 [Exidia glandulosa HHB12029]